MKQYSVEKFNQIVAENVVDKTKRIQRKFAQYAPSLVPLLFVRDKVIVHDLCESKTFLCDYDTPSEKEFVIKNPELIVVKDNIFDGVLHKIMEAIENGDDPNVFRDELLEAVKKKVNFRKTLFPIIESVAYSIKYGNFLMKPKKLRRRLLESIKFCLENIKPNRIKKIMSLPSKLYIPYTIKEGKDLSVKFEHQERNRIVDSFIWNLKLAKKSISGNKIQRELIESMLMEYINDKSSNSIINEYGNHLSANIRNPYLITRADLIIEFSKIAKAKAIHISEDAIKTLADNVYTILMEKNKNQVTKFLTHIFESIEKVADADVHNAIAVARKAQLLFEQGQNVDVDKAADIATKEDDDLVDSDIEDVTTKDESDYNIEDVIAYIQTLKELLKDIDEDKYNELYGDEEKEDEESTDDAEDLKTKDDEDDLFASSEEEKAKEIKESKKIISKIFEGVDNGNILGDEEDDIIAFEENEDVDIEDDTDEIVDDIDGESINDQAQQIVDMIGDLEKMVDEGVVDNDKVDEVAKFLYDYIGSEEGEDKGEDKESFGETGEEETDTEEEEEEEEEEIEIEEEE